MFDAALVLFRLSPMCFPTSPELNPATILDGCAANKSPLISKTICVDMFVFVLVDVHSTRENVNLDDNKTIWEEVSEGLEVLELGDISIKSRAYCSE